MVNKLTSDMSLTANGVRDWIVQRFSAVILGVYFFVLFGFFVFHPHPDFLTLSEFFSVTWVRVFSLIALLSLFLNAWVGVWTVLTDYVRPFGLRFFLEALTILLLITYFFWGIEILWRFV
jgi:succinate dehydrogenase / fumarate reductase membrane anchor subunit